MKLYFFGGGFFWKEMPHWYQLLPAFFITYIVGRDWRNGMGCWMLVLRTHIIKTLELLVNAIFF